VTTFEDLQNSVRLWAAANVPAGCTVIFADPDAPRPEYPYVTLKVTLGNDIGYASESPPNDDGIIRVVKDFELTASVQVYTADKAGLKSAGAIGFGLYNSLDLPSVYGRLSGIVFVRRLTGLQDLTALLNTGREGRTHFDVMFRAGLVIEDDVGLIEHVIGEGEIENTSLPFTMECTD